MGLVFTILPEMCESGHAASGILSIREVRRVVQYQTLVVARLEVVHSKACPSVYVLLTGLATVPEIENPMLVFEFFKSSIKTYSRY